MPDAGSFSKSPAVNPSAGKSRLRIAFQGLMHGCACLLALASLWACSGTGTAHLPARPVDVHIVVPEYPFEDDATLRIDQELLDRLATDFIVQGGSKEEVPAFLFSYLPLECFGGIVRDGPARLQDVGGLLYLSGFFGGVWLEGSLSPVPSGRVSLRSSRPSFRFDAKSLFPLVAGLVRALNGIALSADASFLQRFLFGALDSFIALYGYNLGYLQSILERFPDGAEPPHDYLLCTHFLDCRTRTPEFSLRDDLLPSAGNLIEPRDGPWQEMKTKLDRYGPPAYETGYALWSRVLSTEGMTPGDYAQLLDLSAGFLAVCQALVLSSMNAWVGSAEEQARTSVALAAGLTAWAGGYVLGLASDYPGDHLPALETEGRSPKSGRAPMRGEN